MKKFLKLNLYCDGLNVSVTEVVAEGSICVNKLGTTCIQ